MRVHPRRVIQRPSATVPPSDPLRSVPFLLCLIVCLCRHPQRSGLPSLRGGNDQHGLGCGCVHQLSRWSNVDCGLVGLLHLRGRSVTHARSCSALQPLVAAFERDADSDCGCCNLRSACPLLHVSMSRQVRRCRRSVVFELSRGHIQRSRIRCLHIVCRRILRRARGFADVHSVLRRHVCCNDRECAVHCMPHRNGDGSVGQSAVRQLHDWTVRQPGEAKLLHGMPD